MEHTESVAHSGEIMLLIRAVIHVLVYILLALLATEIYLKINKLWTRKHEKVVAESISVTSKLMAVVLGLIDSLYYFFEKQWHGVITNVLFLMVAVISMAIGLKLWVPEDRKKGLWRLLKEALQQDREEAGNLAQSFFKPSGAKTIIKIFAQIALIDETLDEREKEFIQSFADNWDIDLNWEELTSNRTNASHINYLKLRQDLADYLETSPPEDQVSQFRDVIVALVNIDEEVSEQEQLILAELNGLFSQYLGKKDDLEVYHIVVVPQNERQSGIIKARFPELSEYAVAEGSAYHSGAFYSKKYAEIVCNQYRELNLFGVVAASLPA